MLKVLILDDDPLVVDMLALRLRMPGLHLTTCLEIEAAEALLNAYRYDVVVTDLSVSNLGGLEGMRLIRFVTTNFPDTTIFVLSGFVDDGVRSLCGMLGVAAVLEKPDGLSQLRDLLVTRRNAVPGGLTESTPEVQQIEMLESFLARKPIQSVLQPVVRLQREVAPFEVFGVEGLARSQARSLLSNPSFLLAYAARKEMLFEADMICIRAALDEVQRLGLPVTTFLNIQPRSLTNPELIDQLCEAVEGVGLEEKDIVLELTEQQTIVNPRAFASTLHRLRDRGFRIALDDFGEGSSNLNLFQTLHPDFLKISGTFCHNLANDRFKQIIVQSTAEMAARAGTATVMEAVETAEDADMLRNLGIDYAQGFFFLEPLSGTELARLLRPASNAGDPPHINRSISQAPPLP